MIVATKNLKDMINVIVYEIMVLLWQFWTQTAQANLITWFTPCLM